MSKEMQLSVNAGITIEILQTDFSVCKVSDYAGIDVAQPFVFTLSWRRNASGSLPSPHTIRTISSQRRRISRRLFRR